MAAFYNFHRKLMEQDPPTNAATCLTECDPNQIPNTICTPICVHICPYVCTTTQPPQPPPPTADYFLPPPPKHHHSPLSLPLKISLVILVLTFSLFLLYTLYKFYTVWYRSRTRRHPPPPPPENQENLDEFLDHDVLDHPIWYIRTIGLQPSVISAITVVKYNKTDGVVEGTDCSVCLSDFQEDETLRLLPKCNHAFHISCIDTWLRSHTNCPLCRAGIVKNATNSGSSDQNSDDSGRIEETQMAVSIPDEVDGEERQREDDFQGSELRIGVVDEEDLSSDNNNNNKGEMIGGGGSSDFLIIRRSVSLNDYADFRIISGVNNNNYYSDRHEVQIQPIESDYSCFRERD